MFQKGLLGSLGPAEGVEVAEMRPERWMDRTPGWELGFHLTSRRALDGLEGRSAWIRAFPRKPGKGGEVQERPEPGSRGPGVAIVVYAQRRAVAMEMEGKEGRKAVTRIR